MEDHFSLEQLHPFSTKQNLADNPEKRHFRRRQSDEDVAIIAWPADFQKLLIMNNFGKM